MQHRTYILTGENLQDRVSDFVRMYYQEAHESEYPGGLLRVYEDYSFMNGNYMMVCIRVDFSEVDRGKMKLEFISGGAGDSLFIKDTWGSENRRIEHFQKNLQEFCRTHAVEFDIENP